MKILELIMRRIVGRDIKVRVGDLVKYHSII